ncbi:ATP-binding protein [Edaphobacter flagellatus]|uniref:ATP-binding protein n=1 Tax=Edaphobacter flagellatus TaxID=1933044 RepID=UPI0021B17198|nr:ATP-binding protein [Edaphobacter flagellatus]
MIVFSLCEESALQDQVNYSITFSIESQLNQISLIRAALSGVLNHLGVIESDIFSLELVVTEIINNTLEHGYAGATDKPIEVNVRVQGTEVQIDLSDCAPPFPEEQLHRLTGDPKPLEDADEAWPMRGHGLQIVRQIVDSIAVRSDQQRNHMTIRKHVGLQAS